MHALHQRVGQLLHVAVVLLQDAADAPPPRVQVVSAGLDQAVRADQHGLAGLQDQPGGRVVGVRVDAERQPARGRPQQYRAVGHADRGVRVAGPGDLQHPGRRVHLDVQTGREAQVGAVVAVRHAVQEPRGAGEDGVGAVALGGVGAQCDAELAHEPRRPYVVALDVAHDQREPAPAAGQRDHVVPVAADLEPAAGRHIAGGDLHAGDLRAEPGEHRALKPLRQLPLRLGDLRAGQRLGEHPGHRGEHRALVGGEGDGVGEPRHPGAHRPARDGERQERPGLAVEVGGERPGGGVAGLVLGGRGEIDGAAGAHHLGGRVVGGERHVDEGALVARGLPVVADDGEVVALHAEDGLPVRGEAGHRQPRRHPQHLLGGAGLGERAPGVQQERLARAAPVAGDGGAHDGARPGFGDLLHGADQAVLAGGRVQGGTGAAADDAQDPAVLVHDPQPHLGDGALAEGELDDGVHLAPVHRVEARPHPGLAEHGRLRGQPDQPRGLGVQDDEALVLVPAPQPGGEGGQDLPHGGQGLTSAHCPTVGTSDRTLPPLPGPCSRAGMGESGLRVPGTLGVFHVKHAPCAHGEDRGAGTRHRPRSAKAG